MRGRRQGRPKNKGRRQMSFPIKYCWLVACADNDENFRALHSTMKRNLDGGHFSIFPCAHDPPCRQLTDAEINDLFERWRLPIEAGK
jgi:hypothetical protein